MEGVQSKRLKKLEEKEDRISSLPDSLIHHILSFLPSTKQAIQTGVLSKRWLKQWTFVPVTVFNYLVTPFKNCCRCIDNTLLLHNCSKIKKFHVKFIISPETDSQFTAQVRYATMKCVEELILDMNGSNGMYRLPNFLFSYSSLVKLATTLCHVLPDGKVDWGFLKNLKLHYCDLTGDAIKNILSGSPSLESLELHRCQGFDQLVVASKSLNRLVLSLICRSAIEISCPNLVELRLLYLNSKDLKSMNAPCLAQATLFVHLNYLGEDFEEYQSMVKNILGWIGHVKELILGPGFNEVLSTLSMGVVHSPLVNCKWLTLYVNPNNLPAGIVFALHRMPVLETLFLKVSRHPKDLNAVEDDWWNSNGIILDCSVSHLKTVKIAGLVGLDCAQLC